MTGGPKDDPPPTPPTAGLPDPTSKGSEPSDDKTKKGSGVETKTETTASTSGFREVEVVTKDTKDAHMRWNPPVTSRSAHFTAATSPTRSRDYS